MDELTELAVAAGGGNRAALETLVRRAQPDVWRLCSHLVDRTHADDLTQETFLRALGSLPRFRGDSSVRTWLLAIARNTCADWMRTTTRHRRTAERFVSRRRPTDEWVADASGEIDLETLLARLDDGRRAAFVLTQVLGLSYAEAAEVCSCPVGTIRSRVSRCREDLLAWLDDEAAAN